MLKMQVKHVSIKIFSFISKDKKLKEKKIYLAGQIIPMYFGGENLKLACILYTQEKIALATLYMYIQGDS